MSDEGEAYLEQRLNELRSEINQTLKLFKPELQSFGKAFQDERSTFSTAHRVVDLSTGLPQPSYTKDGKTLLVLNDVQTLSGSLSFGIDEDDDWPDFPTVPKTSQKWPRHAPVDSQEGSDSPSRPAFSEVKAILNKLAQIIYDNPDTYDLPYKPAERSYRHIWDACFRTLEHLRRQVQEQLSMQPEKLNEKRAKKKQTDRRRGRWKSRAHARAAAYEKDKARLGPAVGALAVQACVEGDESETEAGKTAIRAVVAEWCSQENFDAQQQLENLVPSGSSGYTLLKATELRPHDKPLDAKISRIAFYTQSRVQIVERHITVVRPTVSSATSALPDPRPAAWRCAASKRTRAVAVVGNRRPVAALVTL
ncbi:hypothetical protein OC844_006643 [Tilletia horrida]|nr:hypothetical protein OC844_006643 [Tilletia horrida]